MPAGSINSHRSVPAYRTASNQNDHRRQHGVFAAGGAPPRDLCALGMSTCIRSAPASIVSARPGVASCRAAAASCAAAARLLPEPLHGSSPMQLVPMTSIASPVRMPAIDDYGHRWLALDCRHGRVLLLAQGAGGVHKHSSSWSWSRSCTCCWDPRLPPWPRAAPCPGGRGLHKHNSWSWSRSCTCCSLVV